MNERLKNLLKRIDDQKNESIFNICVSQIVKLYALNPRFGKEIMLKLIQLMMSKQMFQRQLAAAMFEQLVDPVEEHIKTFLNDPSATEKLTTIFEVEPYSELLGEVNSDFDKIVESSMKDMDLEKMLTIIRNSSNYLYSKNEKYYNQSKKNKTNSIDEDYVLGRLGGTEAFDVKTISESENPEEYLLSCLEKSKGKKTKAAASKNGKKKEPVVQMQPASDQEDEEFKDEDNDEITKKLKLQDDLTTPELPNNTNKRRVSTILIRVLDVARILLFNLNWETRHGASLIIRAAARKANQFYYFTHHETLSKFVSKEFAPDLVNQIKADQSTGINDILTDTIIRSLLILALDRFSDFMSDKSNIIVRDISSQAVAESINFIKSQEVIVRIVRFFKELMGRDIKQGWEPKHGAIYLMYRLISKIPKLTAHFFKEFIEILHPRITEHEEILEVTCSFFSKVLENDASLVNSKALTALYKSYLDATKKLDDISYAVSPACRLIGDIIKVMSSKGVPMDFSTAEIVKTIMIKFFFHHLQQVRIDLFYMLSNWLIFNSKKVSSGEGFKQVLLLVKMYLVGIYTEEDSTRRQEMINHFHTCTDCFDDESNLAVLELTAELCNAWTIKVFLNISEDKSMEEMVQNSKTWVQTGEEALNSVKLFSTLGPVIWHLFDRLKAAKKSEAQKIFTAKGVNTLALIFGLSINLQQLKEGKSASSTSTSTTLDYGVLLELPIDEISSPQCQFLLETFLENLDSQMRDYIGKLEFPEIISSIFNIFKLLELRKENKWKSILQGLDTTRSDILELKKSMHTLAMANKIPYGVFKMQAETLDTKVIKFVDELFMTVNKLALYVKGLAASILTTKAVKSSQKPQNLNMIIKPLLSLLKLEEVDPNWANLFARGLFNLCVCYDQDNSHPNHKIVKNLIDYCADNSNKFTAEEDAPQSKDPEAKLNRITCEIKPIHSLRYFSLVFERFRENAFEKYPNLKEIFNSAKTVRLFIPVFCKYCPADVIQAALTKTIEYGQQAGRNQDGLRDFKASLVMIFLDSNSKAPTDKDGRSLLNEVLQFLHAEISKPSLFGLETLFQLLNEYDKLMLPFSKVFIKRALKLINEDLDYELKRLVYDIFTRILTLSYVADTDVQPSVLDEPLLGKWQRGNEFLLEFRSNKLYNVDIPDIKSVKLRSYQLEGIAWICFLFRYNLSGALCDDMGLGKTIQSLITVLIFSMQNKGSKSIIVAPNSLVKHWEIEAGKHLAGHPIKVGIIDKGFTGNWKQFKDVNLFITSDTFVVRSAHLFEKEQFLVGILDEAHLIKNEKSKLSKSIKTLSIRHKLALTGTPIQNNLLELWSIFDFLMPNYLGAKEDFKKSFARLFNLNLINIDISKMDLNDDQTKDLQMLHQKVLPFIMRRLKSQVLQDLPEKIIQDYYCELTDVQKKVYKIFEDTDVMQIEKTITAAEKPQNGANGKEDDKDKKKIPLLGSLIAMRKICNHPCLTDPKYLSSLTHEESQDLRSFDNSGKFKGLRTLFEQLDFDPDEDNYDNPNKILIFTRFLDTMALLEEFLKKQFPTVKYVKIDGQIDATKRYGIIDRFFNEYDLKVMLLTTKVGGLGLNLSVANIVVMFDHDFNPMNDIQAIERAHRLGQKKVVNVYRFITKDTLEERIMGIQKFKLSVANTVINMENSSISNIKDSKLVTLLDNLAEEQSKINRIEDEKANPSHVKTGVSKALEKILEESDLKTVWQEDEYDREYR